MHHDLLDETVLPLFGLSASTIAAIAIGGALGTLARYLFEVHHPVADGRFPWVTLVVNLSGSLAIGFLIPLTERAIGPCSGASAPSRHRPPGRMDHLLHRGRRSDPSPASRCARHLPGLPGGNGCGWSGARRRGSRSGSESDGAVTSHSPTLGLALLVAAAGGCGAVLRALLIHHLGLRRDDPLPVGTMVVNASGSLVLGLLTGLSLYHGLGPHVLAVLGVGLCGGYTTWSTASWETLHLLHTGHRIEALVYSLGGLAVCVGAAAAGLGVAALI